MSEPRYVQVRPGVLAAWCAEHELSDKDRALLVHLVGETDWRTGTVKGFSLTRCSAEIGLGSASGRRTLSLRLGRLVDAGAIDYRAARGNHAGYLAVVLYGDFVRRSVARLPRDGTRSVARLPRDGTPESPVPPGVLPSVDVNPVDKPLALTAQGQGQGGLSEHGDRLLAGVAGRAPLTARADLLTAPAQNAGRQVLRRLLVELADVVGDDQAVELVVCEWPPGVGSSVAHALARARRRLAEAVAAGASEAEAAQVLELDGRRRHEAELGAARQHARTLAHIDDLDDEDRVGCLRANYAGDALAAALDELSMAGAGGVLAEAAP